MAAAITNYGDGFTAAGYGASSTIGPVNILGGHYMAMANDTGNIAATLEILGPDGTTYLTAATAFSAAGVAAVYLPPGKVQVAIGSGATLASFSLIRIPTRGP